MTQSENQHDQHADVIDMLPWFANGSLEEQSHERVQRSIDTCVACRNEFEQVLLLQRSVASTEIAVPASAPALRSMLSRIENERSSGESGASVVQGNWRLSDWLAEWFNPALGVAVAASLVLAVMVLIRDDGSKAENSYSMLSSEKADSSVRFLVRVSENASLVEAQSLLEAALHADSLRVEASSLSSDLYIAIVPAKLIESRMKQQSRVQVVAEMLSQLQGESGVINAELVP